MPRLEPRTWVVVALLAATSSAADPFSDASLDGGYSFHLGADDALAPGFFAASSLGRIVADGDGHVTASRSVMVQGERVGGYPQRLRFEQAGVGTYQVLPSGLGTMTLTWSPPITLDVSATTAPYYPPGCVVRELHAEEQYDVALGGDGFELRQLHAWTESRLCTGPFHPSPTAYDVDSATQGRATSDALPCAPAATLRIQAPGPGPRSR